MNKRIVLSLILIGLLVAGAIFLKQKQVTSQSSKLEVEATFYPLAEFSRQVGGNFVNVQTLIPPGSEPHDFEPSTQAIATLHQVKVYVYNGAGFEGWLNKILPDLMASGVITVNSSKEIRLLPADPTLAESSSTIDPHIWLDPVLAQQQVKSIEASFIQADPAHKTAYQTQTDAYLQKLEALDQQFRLGLANCSHRTIVTSHAAFAYLAKEYGLSVIPISGLSPDEEPSPQRLANIVQQVKSQHIHYIFFESLVSPTLANTIATETGAQTLVFNPLEGLSDTDIAQGKEYIFVQQQNLQNLRTALSCQ